MNIDMLSHAPAHKFHGPKGVGALYARRGIILTNIIEGGAQERGKRAGTENVPGIVGMAAALKDACDHLDENSKKVTALRDRLIEGLSEIPHCALNGARSPRLPGNVNFCFEGIEGESLLLLLDAKGISASSGSACTSGSLDPSHVLLAIGRPARGGARLAPADPLRGKHDGRSRVYAEGNSAGGHVSSQYVSCVERARARRKAVYAVI